MKLAFIINVFREDDFHSGGEKLFYELVNRSINDGYKVDLYCTSYLSSKNALKNRLNRLTLLGRPKDFKHPHKIEVFYENVKNLTQKENYDFIISENISPVIDTEKHIGILQGHSMLHYRNRAGNVLSRAWFSVKKHRHIRAQKEWLKTPYKKIIVPSNVLKEELVQNFGIPKERILVMHPGVDTPIETISTSKADSPFTFGLSAPSFGKKGGYVFLKALNQLKCRGYDFRAKIIYPKHAKNIGLQLALSRYGLRNVVEFMPYQADMSGFYSSVDCVVMPSVLETFGLVALEGMINGKPAIVSSFCGAKEIITDGENGFVFDMEGKKFVSASDTGVSVSPDTIDDFNYEDTEEQLLKNDIKKFNQDIQDFHSGKLKPTSLIYVMQTIPKIWQNVGLPNKRMVLPQEVYKKIINLPNKYKKNHNLDKETVKRLPELIANPDYILQSSAKDKEHRFIGVLNAYDSSGCQIIIIIEPAAKQLKLNIITSSYGKNNLNIEKERTVGRVLYDKKIKPVKQASIEPVSMTSTDFNITITDISQNFNPEWQTPRRSLADRMELFLNNSVNYSILSRKVREKASTYSWEAFYEKFKSEILND